MKYTVQEIDRMRDALYRLDGTIHFTTSTPEAVAQRAKIEDRLRTHMLNGTSPEELEALCGAGG
jgi:hypothetical protein